MKILIVGGMFPPMRTGTAFYTFNLANALQVQGHQVEVVTLGKHGTYNESGVRVHRLPALRIPLSGFFKHFQLCAWNPANWYRLNLIARSCRAEVILLVNHYLDIAFPALFAAGLRKIPLVCSVGTQLQSLNPRRNRILNLLDRFVCGLLIFQKCDRIVAWDTQIQQYLMDVHGKSILQKIEIVNYGVNGDPARLLAHRHDYSEGNVIVGVGAVSEQRSFVPLVQAFSRLAPRYPKLRLRIIGHIYYEAAVRLVSKLGLSGRVEFLGELPHEAVVEEMCRSSLLYSSLTGKYVGLGTAAIEAMLLALPAVVNVPLDLLGTGKMENRRHIVQCNTSDPQRIAECIESLVNDPELRRRVGEGGREFVRKHLNWEVVARNMVKVFERTCENIS